MTEYRSALDVVCSTCHAAAGRPCIGPDGVICPTHAARIKAARLYYGLDDGERLAALPGYERLAAVLDAALEQAQAGKGRERHALAGEAFHDQQIVQLGEWMRSTAFAVGQGCKKAIESTRLDPAAARRELLGAIVYLAAAAIQIERGVSRG